MTQTTDSDAPASPRRTISLAIPSPSPTHDYILTEPRLTDCPHITAIFAHPIKNIPIYKGTLSIPNPFTLELCEKWVTKNQANFASEGAVLGFMIRAVPKDTGGDGMPVGWIDFRRDERLLRDDDGNLLKEPPCGVELGYWLDPEHGGYGVMGAAVKAMCDIAFNDVGVERVFGQCFVENAASARVMERAGMKLDGTLRALVRKHGKPMDCKQYSILRHEWEALRTDR
ncbi:acyl-CoA N-acyltransferase [Fimicolochytrium jonesii]|uniref:acyl-CoA N-acyltransferase n=1 Tax=Fimicolochytrium jonesii TaxID=1396493 RepID=UPI0022FED021|nr:acyl-CoA N-acyltransferase [Fimicolochytrium jonesii]KAI8827194.1 acyl-CoA N-acyltransferase [Fimicolochytrium jonesii]